VTNGESMGSDDEDEDEVSPNPFRDLISLCLQIAVASIARPQIIYCMLLASRIRRDVRDWCQDILSTTRGTQRNLIAKTKSARK